MEISVFILGVFFEKARPDLKLRRWWRARGVRLPALAGPRVHGVPVPVALAGVDARRLLLRPTTLLVAYVLYRVFSPTLPIVNAYDGVNRLLGFSLAILGLAVMAVVASIGGRDRGAEIVEATPGGERSPLLSWVVLLSAAAVVEYALLVGVRFGRPEPLYGDLLPDAWQLAQGPIMLIGGGLLGLLAARLLPVWVAAPLAVVVGIAWVGTVSGSFDSTTMLAPVIEWVQYREDNRTVVEPGSFGWHNAYLLGLCGLGVVAVLLTAPGRRHALLLAGSAVGIATVVAGALALP